MDSIRIPGGSSFWGANSFYLIRLVKPGFEDILAMTSTLPGSFRICYKRYFIQKIIQAGSNTTGYGLCGRIRERGP